MTNEQSAFTKAMNEFRAGALVISHSDFVIGHSVLLSHSDFVIRAFIV